MPTLMRYPGIQSKLVAQVQSDSDSVVVDKDLVKHPQYQDPNLLPMLTYLDKRSLPDDEKKAKQLRTPSMVDVDDYRIQLTCGLSECWEKAAEQVKMAQLHQKKVLRSKIETRGNLYWRSSDDTHAMPCLMKQQARTGS